MPTQESLVYFVQETGGGPIKIGCSDDPQARLAWIQIANAYPMILLGTLQGGIEKEAEIVKRFQHLSLGGEWFTGSPEPKDFITTHCV